MLYLDLPKTSRNIIKLLKKFEKKKIKPQFWNLQEYIFFDFLEKKSCSLIGFAGEV